MVISDGKYFFLLHHIPSKQPKEAAAFRLEEKLKPE
jgi:hypothetical protein